MLSWLFGSRKSMVSDKKQGLLDGAEVTNEATLGCLPGRDLSDFVGLMKGNSVTDKWDAIYSVHRDTLNQVLASNHAAGHGIHNISYRELHGEKKDLYKVFNVTLGVPVLSFDHLSGGHAIINMSITGGSSYYQAKAGGPPFGKVDYKLGDCSIALNVPIASIEGHSGAITEYGRVSVFGVNDAHHVFLNFDVDQIKFSAYGPKKVDVQDYRAGIASYFQNNFDVVGYTLASMNNTVLPSFMNVALKAFKIKMYDDVMSFYIQTDLSDHGEGDNELSFKPNNTEILPIPSTYDMSFILSYDSYKSYLEKQFKDMTNIESIVGDDKRSASEGGIYVKINNVKLKGDNCKDNNVDGNCYYSSIEGENDKFLGVCYIDRTRDTLNADDPLLLSFGPNLSKNLHVYRDHTIHADCHEKSFNAKCGVVNLRTKLDQNFDFTVNSKLGINPMRVHLTGDMYHHYTSNGKSPRGDCNRGATCKCDKIDTRKYDLGVGDLNFEGLNLLPTTSVFIPSADLFFDEEAGVHFPMDILLVGHINIPQFCDNSAELV